MILQRTNYPIRNIKKKMFDIFFESILTTSFYSILIYAKI